MNVKLVYLKGSNNMSLEVGFDTRLWNVIEPHLEGYSYLKNRYPTLGVLGLKDVGLIEDKDVTLG